MSNSIKKLIFLTIAGGLFFAAVGKVSAQNCTPSVAQVAIFAGKNYTGKCILFDAGQYSTPSSVGFDNDNIMSARVGAYVWLNVTGKIAGSSDLAPAMLYSDNNDLTKTDLKNYPVMDFSVNPVDDLMKKMMGTWILGDQTIVIGKYNLKVNRNGNLSFESNLWSYEDTVTFKMPDDGLSGGSKEIQKKVTFNDVDQTMTWLDTANNTTTEYKRVLKAANDKSVDVWNLIMGSWILADDKTTTVVFSENKNVSLNGNMLSKSYKGGVFKNTQTFVLEGNIAKYTNSNGVYREAKVSFENNGNRMIWDVAEANTKVIYIRASQGAGSGKK